MKHPAHRLAEMAADAAEELRGYLAPAADLPWELTRDDHRNLVPRLYGAVSRLAECISAIAEATGDEDATRHLAEAARTILRGGEHVQTAGTMLTGEQRGPEEPGTTALPPQLAASDFPQPMTAHLFRAAGANPTAPARRQMADPTTLGATRDASNQRR